MCHLISFLAFYLYIVIELVRKKYVFFNLMLKEINNSETFFFHNLYQ